MKLQSSVQLSLLGIEQEGVLQDNTYSNVLWSTFIETSFGGLSICVKVQGVQSVTFPFLQLDLPYRVVLIIFHYRSIIDRTSSLVSLECRCLDVLLGTREA